MYVTENEKIARLENAFFRYVIMKTRKKKLYNNVYNNAFFRCMMMKTQKKTT